MYKDYTPNEVRRKLQTTTRLVYILHKRLIKPKNPVLLHCANCGRPICECNSDTIEVQNSFGVDQQSLKASDNWIRIKCNSCGSHVSILWS